MSQSIIATLISAIILAGCSTSIRYAPWSETDPPLQATSLKFALQDSSVIFAMGGKPEADPATAGAHVLGAEKPCKEAAWWECFNNVTPTAIMSLPIVKKRRIYYVKPSEAQSKDSKMLFTPQDSEQPEGPKMYVALPSDARHLYLSSTSISGIPVAGQDGLYTQINIKYTNNTGALLSGAGAGAGVGASFGPPGVIFGSLAGLVGAVPGPLVQAGGPQPAPAPAAPPPRKGRSIEDYLCESSKFDFSSAQNLAPSLYVPLTISAAEARPFASNSSVEMKKDEPSSCWHVLPNSKYVSQSFPVTDPSQPPLAQSRALKKGDGWLYRFIATEDLSKMPPGAHESAESYFDPSKGSRQDFPISSCRGVVIQVLWWKELAKAIADADKNGTEAKPVPNAIIFDSVAADPEWVTVVPMKHGGVINFKKSCGANISLTPDYSNNAFINSAMSAAQKIQAAQEASKK